MFARMTTGENKIAWMDKFVKIYKESIVPAAKQQKGYYGRSFYMLAKIYEQKGWKGKAIEHYQKFLDLWKDADPGIPEVEDAGTRLAQLKEKY